ncbi:MAG: hypothetical protein AABZ69_04745, partial [Candidatus Binatota bacterium]
MTQIRKPRVFYYKLILWAASILSLSGLLGVAVVVYYYGHDLPSRLDLTSNYQPSVVSTVYDVQGRPIG